MKAYLALLGLLLAVSYALANVGYGHGSGHHQHQGHGHGWHGHQDYHAKPYYKFSYGVNDHYTHDQKYHHEHRDGDRTQGAYGLREADGSWRNVYYSVDGHKGFQAHVVRTPNHHGHGHGQQG